MKWDFSFFKNNQVQNEQNNEKVIIRQPNLALLIDADNVSANVANELINEASRFGNLAIRRIYGDWSNPIPPQNWNKQILSRYGLSACQQFAHVKGKDATDMLLIINAMDILYTQAHIDGFVIVSSDSDFTALATRLREGGKKVIAFGALKTSQAFREACDHFFYVENLRSLQRMINPEVDKAKSLAMGEDLPNKITEELKNNIATHMDISLSFQNRLIHHLMLKKNQTDLLTNICGFFHKHMPDYQSHIPTYQKLPTAFKALPYIQSKKNPLGQVFLSLKMLPENKEKEALKEEKTTQPVTINQENKPEIKSELLPISHFMPILKSAFEHLPKDEMGCVAYPALLNQIKMEVPDFHSKPYGYLVFAHLLKAIPELELFEYPREDGKLTSKIRFKTNDPEALPVENENNRPALVGYLNEEFNKKEEIQENNPMVETPSIENNHLENVENIVLNPIEPSSIETITNEETVEPLENIVQAIKIVLAEANDFLQASQMISEAKKICPKFDDYKKHGFTKFNHFIKNIDGIISEPIETSNGTMGYRLKVEIPTYDKNAVLSIEQVHELVGKHLSQYPKGNLINIINLQKELSTYYPSFSYRELGFNKLSQFMNTIPNTEMVFLNEAKTAMAIRLVAEKALQTPISPIEPNISENHLTPELIVENHPIEEALPKINHGVEEITPTINEEALQNEIQNNDLIEEPTPIIHQEVLPEINNEVEEVAPIINKEVLSEIQNNLIAETAFIDKENQEIPEMENNEFVAEVSELNSEIIHSENINEEAFSPNYLVGEVVELNHNSEEDLNHLAEETAHLIMEDEPEQPTQLISDDDFNRVPNLDDLVTEEALPEENYITVEDEEPIIPAIPAVIETTHELASNAEWLKLWLENRKEYCQQFSALFCSYASDLNEFSVYLDELLLTDGQDEHQNDESFWQMNQGFLRQTQNLHHISTVIDETDTPTGSAYQFMSHIKNNLAWVLGHLNNLSHYFVPLNAQQLHLNRQKHNELISVSRALNMMAEDFKTDCSSFKTLCQSLPTQNPVHVRDDEALYEEVDIAHKEETEEFIEIDIDNEILPAVTINFSEEEVPNNDLEIINRRVLEIIKNHQVADEYLSIFLIQKELKLQYLDYGFDRFSNFMKQVPHVEVNPENDYECRWIRDDV